MEAGGDIMVMSGGYEREDTQAELEARREAERRKAEQKARAWVEKPLPPGSPGSRFFPPKPAPAGEDGGTERPAD